MLDPELPICGKWLFEADFCEEVSGSTLLLLLSSA